RGAAGHTGRAGRILRHETRLLQSAALLGVRGVTADDGLGTDRQGRASQGGRGHPRGLLRPGGAAVALDTRERVRKAAVKLFADKGFHGTGIRELAQESRLSTASLYHYMGSKEDLLVDIMRTCLQSLRDSATAAVADVRDPVQRLTTLVKLHVKAHARMPKETWIVDNEIHVLSPALRRSVIALRD